ncbi:MAG: carboxypeptidase-like regulatory domain-containing protein, partial [candidate division KSB1 bacterium]|nr:carboxypeptidase-like regulatory domain-containing protein [candidate division KSB1 bacterium]
MTSFRRMFRVGIASELGVLVLMASLTWAGTTGKIAGVVKDADSGEPLPLANVTLKGTYLGAATDVKGRYHILSVPPGTYTLVVTMM